MADLWAGVSDATIFERSSAPPNLEAKELRGRVVRLFRGADTTWSSGEVRTDSGTRRFAGACKVVVGEEVVLHGSWVKHQTYGLQFDVKLSTFNHGMSKEGLARYLEKHPALVGIGPAKARLIAETFGEAFDRVIDEEPERVVAAAGLSMQAVQVLREEWLSKRDRNASLTWLAALGLTYKQSAQLVERYSNSVVRVLEEDPYAIVRDVPSFGFKKADKLAVEKLGIPKDHPSRIRAGLLYCITDRLWSRGDCWVRYKTLLDVVEGKEALDMNIPLRLKDEALESLVANCEKGKYPGLRIDDPGKDPPRLEDSIVADPNIYKQETDLASIFTTWGKNKKQLSVDNLEPRLNEEQHRAVCAAAQYNLVLITGGAGSGKTFTIAAIVRMYKERGLSVVLVAPTGKAAQRMKEVVGIDAKTIHRQLGYMGDSFSVGPGQLEADVVIVDEVSMVDVPLAWYLLRAVDFSRTNVVLVGDHNQLPPVGPGNVLRDLVNRRPIPTVVLDEIMRQAGALKENSRAILRGEVRLTAGREWVLEDGFNDARGAQRRILELFQSEETGFKFDDIQLLTPKKDGPLGTHVLNAELQRIVQKKFWGVDVEATPGRPKFLLRDRVIQNRNNYKIGVMNGTIGTVVRAGNGPLVVRFDGRDVEFVPDKASPDDLLLAYALTVHKAQGSEFPCVVLVIHRDHAFSPLHHRNLFYTGVTRAQKSVIIVGDTWSMQRCAKKEETDRRDTFLSILPLTRTSEGDTEASSG